MVENLFLNHGKQIILFHDEEFVTVNLDGLAAVFAEQDAVTDLDGHGADFALVILLARADSQHFALIGLFGSTVRNDDARGGLGFVFDALDNDAIVQRTKPRPPLAFLLRVDVYMICIS